MRVFAGLAAAAIAAVGVLPALLGRSIAHRPAWIGAAVVSLVLGVGGDESCQTRTDVDALVTDRETSVAEAEQFITTMDVPS